VTKPNEYGLLIERTNSYGTEYIEVRVCRRDGERDFPLGCTDTDFFDAETPKHMVGLSVDGLGMYGFVSISSDRAAFIGYEPYFRNTYSADAPRLRRMLKTITLVNARIRKNEAYEAGDKFAALAQALKLTFVVERVSTSNNTHWHWMTAAEGRNRYRGIIDTAVANATPQKEAV
jgi:hypothetical protein